MNNLKDISMKYEYAAMLGYTDEELASDFAPYIARTARQIGISENELHVKIRDYYDAMIPYDIYEREGAKAGEGFYHALLLALMWSSQIPTLAENHSYKGRSDVEIEYRGKAYVIELKVAADNEACERAANDAIAQIKSKGYADKFSTPDVTLIGLAVDKAERSVGAFRIVPARYDR